MKTDLKIVENLWIITFELGYIVYHIKIIFPILIYLNSYPCIEEIILSYFIIDITHDTANEKKNILITLVYTNLHTPTLFTLKNSTSFLENNFFWELETKNVDINTIF